MGREYDRPMRGPEQRRAERGDEVETVRVDEQRAPGLSALAYQPVDEFAGRIANPDSRAGDEGSLAGGEQLQLVDSGWRGEMTVAIGRW